MTKASDNVFPRLLISEGGSTSTPAANRVTVYAKSDGLLYSKDDAGAETALGGGDITTDTAWAAKGDLIVGTANNTAAVLTAGNNGKVLMAASGEATGLKWETAGGGALVLLEQHTASDSATLDFTTCITSTYDEYQIELVNLVPATNAQPLNMRCSTDGGSNYDTGNNYSSLSFRYLSNASAAGGNDGTSAADLTGGGGADNIDNTAANGGLCGTYRLYDPLSATQHKRFVGSTTIASSNGNRGAVTSGSYKSTTAVNALQFYMASGNITSGTIRVYGIAKA